MGKPSYLLLISSFSNECCKSLHICVLGHICVVVYRLLNETVAQVMTQAMPRELENASKLS